MSLSYLTTCNRRSGKTYAICKAAKEIGATVVCHNLQEAKKVAKEYGVKTTSYNRTFVGTTGPYLVDTHAVSMYAGQCENRISQLINQLNEAVEEIVTLQTELFNVRKSK